MILLRPHHVLCMHGFIGNGYTEEFAENMYSVIRQIKESNKVKQSNVAKTNKKELDKITEEDRQQLQDLIK